jgi:hypothetical protein
MIESREGTVDVQKLAAAAVGNRDMQEPTSREHPTDKRFVQRHANARKARAGHRRNIRRSNTNG